MTPRISILCISIACMFTSLSLYTARSYKIQTSLPFTKVVIWGHKLHTHTHSYIHHAFHKTFTACGYPTYWFDNSDNISTFDFSNTLFITEGQVDQNIPLRNDCLYILHNCNLEKYTALINDKRCIILQVYTHDVLTRDVVKVDECIYYSVPNLTIYMPWATDLLPHEIDRIKRRISTPQQKKKLPIVYWIGTWCSGMFGNDRQLNEFKRACEEHSIILNHTTNCGPQEAISLIQSSYMAPAIQGGWQCERGYIPCRIFKNISYGQFGITNSKTVHDLFKGKIVYNPDTYQLFFDAKKKLETLTSSELYALMEFVRDNHTYIARITLLLDFFEKVRAA